MFESLKTTIRHGRAMRLSDPHDDNFAEDLEALLNKDDSKLTWMDYQRLLGPHLPAGTYYETVYFLPLAFARMIDYPDEALDMVSAVFGYCSKNVKNFAAESLVEEVKGAITKCYRHWTKEFKVQHFDKTMCQAKGWGISYTDYVTNSEEVCEGLVELVRFDTLSDVSREVVSELAHSSAISHQAWFLELLRAKLHDYPPDVPEELEIFSNKELIGRALSRVQEELVESEPSPTYWSNTIALIELYLEDIRGC